MQILIHENLESFHQNVGSQTSHLGLNKEAALSVQVARVQLVLLWRFPLESFCFHSLFNLLDKSVCPQYLGCIWIATCLEHFNEPFNVELGPDFDPVHISWLEISKLQLSVDYAEGTAYLSLVHLVRGQLLLVLQLFKE